MNEAEFVRFLTRNFPFPQGVGIGDDCSVTRRGRDHELVTTDLLIENVHFRLTDVSPGQLALKSLAVNVSDIAAMGGSPQACYLGLGFPVRLDDRWLKDFFGGMRRGCRRWGLALGGGDVSRAAHLLISITVIGHARRVVLRSGAQPDDLIGITGRTGESALGWKLIESGCPDRYYTRRHQQVEPELANGRALAGLASAMIDVSDGLLLDLSRVLEASGRRGAEIDMGQLPLSPRFRDLCRLHGWDERQLALTGGEDYVLLFTLPPEAEKRLRRRGVSFHLIGRVTAAPGLKVYERGREVAFTRLGYDHFRTMEEPSS
jgi:thiamine-monophosphate kinase